ncbi:type IV pilus biogenesis protein PilM [Brevibacillus sp. SAFN-007a]|uniref:type IV pilus biogenesis protein PilM n=1 Tax=Brevibacillus sp. SAFN-007a TaxID=3436862 RepID=UPI003F7DD78E
MTIEDDGIRIVETSQSAGAVQIHQMGMIPLERGLLVGGKIMDQQALEQQLSAAKNQLLVSGNKVCLAVPSSFVVIRKIALPRVPEKEVRPLIEIELESSVHLPFSRPYFDYYKLPKNNVWALPSRFSAEKLGAGEEEQYLVIAAPGDVIDQYLSLLKLLRLEATSVDIEPLALYRLLSSSGMELSRNLLVVQLGLRSINVGIFEGDIPEFLRSIPLDLEHYKNSADENGLSTKELLSFLEHRSAFSAFAEEWVRELERVINFYQFSLKNGTVKLDTMYLTGDFPDLDRMVRYLRERLPQLKIAPLPLERMEHVGANQAKLQAFSVALGLSLRG